MESKLLLEHIKVECSDIKQLLSVRMSHDLWTAVCEIEQDVEAILRLENR